MPLHSPLMPLLPAFCPLLAALAALPLRRLPPSARRFLGAATAGMQIAAALFFLLLPACAFAEALPPAIQPLSSLGVLAGALIGHFCRRTTAVSTTAKAFVLPPAIALGALTASLTAPATTAELMPLLCTAAIFAAHYLADNLRPGLSAPYAGFMQTCTTYLPACSATLIAYALASQLPWLQVLLLAAAAGAILCRTLSYTVPQLQQSYRDNLCTVCITTGFAAVLLLYALCR